MQDVLLLNGAHFIIALNVAACLISVVINKIELIEKACPGQF